MGAWTSHREESETVRGERLTEQQDGNRMGGGACRQRHVVWEGCAIFSLE